MLSPAVAGRLAAGLRAQCAVQRRLRDRPGNPQGGRSLSGRHQSRSTWCRPGTCKTLWVANNADRRSDGSLTPIDPEDRQARPQLAGRRSLQHVFHARTASSAIVVAEALKRLDFRDPHTMTLQHRCRRPGLRRHQPRRFLDRRALRDLHLRVPRRRPRQGRHGQPQGRGLPEARRAAACRRTSASRPTARCSSSPTCWPTACSWSTATASPRSASSIPASARTASIRAATAPSSMSPTAARNKMHGPPHGHGQHLRLDFATRKVVATGRSPAAAAPTWAMSAPTASLWLSGRFDNVVYAIDTATGAVHEDPGRHGAARPDRLAAARPLFARPHRQYALAADADASYPVHGRHNRFRSRPPARARISRRQRRVLLPRAVIRSAHGVRLDWVDSGPSPQRPPTVRLRRERPLAGAALSRSLDRAIDLRRLAA